ncbi:MAG TPA: S26 family signal peptidase, partial [Planctomycetota bacterium]|nr:S26 family signal peptidase [Planctomycetota bacterium]
LRIRLSARRRLALLVLLALLLAAVIGLDAGFDAYAVPTGSMEPLLHGDRSTGDRVLVRSLGGLGPTLRRFDLAVFRSPDGVHCVKRVAGRPNERVQILEGDLYVESALLRKDRGEREAVLVTIFDPDRDPGAGFWEPAGGAWRAEGGARVFDATDAAGSPALLRYGAPVRDDYLDPDGRRVAGRLAVSDLSLEALLTPLTEGGELRIELSGRGDRFLFALERRGDRGLARIARRSPKGEEVLLRGETAALPTGVPVRLEAVNVDQRLAFLVDGREILPPFDYDRPATGLPPGGAAGPADGGETSGGGAALGGLGLRARLGRVRLRRDLHYEARGRYGVERPVDLGPDEYFFLGDNSGESLDCREWGPVEGRALLGTPVFIYWPPRRIRGL